MPDSFVKRHLKPWGLAIVEKYPLIFLEDNHDFCGQYKIPTSEFVALRYGFECGEGWAKLIEEIASTGTKIIERFRLADGMVDVHINSFICKEKFGTLRWQGDRKLPDPFNKLWDSFIGDIESQSSRTCELTGAYGTLCRNSNGWQKTLCKEKAKELGYQDAEEYWKHRQSTGKVGDPQ